MDYKQVRKILLVQGWQPLDADQVRAWPPFPEFPEVACGSGWQAACSGDYFRGDQYFSVMLDPGKLEGHLLLESTWQSREPEMLARDRRVVKAIIAANSQGSVEIHARSRQIQMACGTEKVWLSWNNAVPGSTLVTCDCSCTSHDNSGWLIESGLKDRKPRVRRVSLGKVSSLVEFKRAGGQVQDIISSHPWCSGTKPKAPLNAVFTTLMKQPSQSEDAPYCFTPQFFVGDGSAPLRMVPAADDMPPGVPEVESAMVAREVERLRAWRPED